MAFTVADGPRHGPDIDAELPLGRSLGGSVVAVVGSGKTPVGTNGDSDGRTRARPLAATLNGQPVRAVVAPDVFVVFGVPDRLDRKSYVLWREPEAEIRFVLEIASASTRRRDHTVKRDVYASLGVREYFLFDLPERDRPARLTGLRLRNHPYHEIAAEVLPDSRRGIRSDVVGLVAHVNAGGNLRWVDPVAGVDLNTYDEAEDARQQEAAARQRAEARVTELEAELRRNRR